MQTITVQLTDNGYLMLKTMAEEHGGPRHQSAVIRRALDVFHALNRSQANGGRVLLEEKGQIRELVLV